MAGNLQSGMISAFLSLLLPPHLLMVVFEVHVRSDRLNAPAETGIMSS
jgi:hypothetical protein